MSTEQLLAERRKTHGDYREHAEVTQEVLTIWKAHRNWDKLTYSQKETLHMIAHKVGRIVTGDPNVKDHWDDIAGYATLISQQLGESNEKERKEREAPIQRDFRQPGYGQVTIKTDPNVIVTNTNDIHDQYRRYREANITKGPVDTFYEWWAKQSMVPREDSNKHAFQEEDGA